MPYRDVGHCILGAGWLRVSSVYTMRLVGTTSWYN